MYKVGELIENSKELEKAAGFFTANHFIKCSALALTLRNEKADSVKVIQGMNVIKNKTSIFSNFRGNNLFLTATTIAREENMEDAMSEINYIYSQLKEKFFASEYLILAAIVIFDARERLDKESIVNNTRGVYDYMKKNHKFLTGCDDVAAAAMIAVNSNNIEKTMEEIELYYDELKNNGFWSGNNLQALSHILPLFNGSIEEKIQRIILMDRSFRENRISIKGYALPLLGVAAIVAEDPNDFAKQVKEIDDIIKKEKGFGNFVLGHQIRNMISLGLAASQYIEGIEDCHKEKLINATNNVALTIQIAIEIATTSAIAGAAAASAAANS